MQNELIDRIRKTTLKGDQEIIARKITSNLHKVAFLTGSQLAEECNVSVSAITRFAQKIGYEGFPELKQDLEELYRKTTTPYEMFESFVESSKDQSVVGLSLSQDLKNIESISANFQKESFDEAVSLISDASKVYLAGAGASCCLIDYVNCYFEAIEKPTYLLKSFGLIKQAELLDFECGEVLIGFSFQRILKEVRDVFRLVRPFGVKTVAITDSPINALAVEADISLISPVIGTTFGASLVAPMAMTNAIVNSVTSKNKKKSLASLKKAKKSWETKPIFCE